MSIKIRLARGGRKGKPFYRVNVTDSRNPRDGKFIEKVGTYNPLLEKGDENRLVINKERAEYWISVGAKPSERVAILLCELGVKGADKYKPEYTPKKKGDGAKKKAQEAMQKAAEAAAEAKEAEEKAAAEAKEAAAQPKVEEAQAEEAPAEEVKTEETPAEEAKTEEAKTEEAKTEEAKA